MKKLANELEAGDIEEEMGKLYHLINYFFLVYSYVHTLFGPFLPPAPPPLPLPPRFQAETVLPLCLILLQREYKQ
jgi:hypothetical protein